MSANDPREAASRRLDIARLGLNNAAWRIKYHEAEARAAQVAHDTFLTELREAEAALAALTPPEAST